MNCTDSEHFHAEPRKLNPLQGIVVASLIGAVLWLLILASCAPKWLTARGVLTIVPVDMRWSHGERIQPHAETPASRVESALTILQSPSRGLPGSVHWSGLSRAGEPLAVRKAQALRSDDVCFKGQAAMRYEAADLADAFRRIGSTCRTPAAIRARVRTGYMSPDEHTPRGGALWTAEGLQRELLHEARLIRYFGADTSRRLQRWYAREAVQLELRA